MGYIKEPKGVDFVIEPIPLTPEDKQMISNAIALYKATGITKAARGKKTRKTGNFVQYGGGVSCASKEAPVNNKNKDRCNLFIVIFEQNYRKVRACVSKHH